MHYLFLGIFKRNLEFLILFRNRSSKAFINKANLNILNERILKFPINSHIKRKPKKLTEPTLKKWKANQLLEFFFYLLPICFKSLIDERVYRHFFIFIFFISKLWRGGINSSQLKQLNQLVNIYLKEVEEFFSRQNYTINQHQLDGHVIDSFINQGPIGKNTAFPFESAIGDLVKCVKSPTAILEQIIQRDNLKFSEILVRIDNKETRLLGKGHKVNGRIRYKRILINNQIYSSFNLKKKNLVKDYFVITKDRRCYKVLYYYYENQFFFHGIEIHLDKPLSIFFKKEKLELDYIVNCRPTKKEVDLNINNIKDKVLFLSKFCNKSSNIKEQSGYVIELVHKFHN